MVKVKKIDINFFIVFIFTIFTIFTLIIYFKVPKLRFEFFETEKRLIFKAPPSLTIITPRTKKIKDNGNIVDLIKNIPSDKEEYHGNILSYPSFFHCNEKWPGSLPRPLFQGSCGSCWSFAAVTCLGSRFYIESCGLSGCQNYPQVNFGSLDLVNGNLNQLYKFRAIYLEDAFKDIDTDRNGSISKKEWMNIVKKYYDIFNSNGTPIGEKHYIAQILVYILNFQSLGSINLYNWVETEERGLKTFDIWINFVNLFKELEIGTKKARSLSLENKEKEKEKEEEQSLNILDLKTAWANEPITLSAEKVISCCTKCMELDFDNSKILKNIACEGSTLDDAWSMLKESGTPTAMCIGYNLDNYTESDPLPTCREIQGPFYSFCSGYSLDRKSGQSAEEWSNNLNNTIDKFENSGIDPVAIPHTEQQLPWIDPQLFRFRSKNVYKVNNNVRAIQREIIERGPVTAGFELYESFQGSFGTVGMGGQLYNDRDTLPVGSSSHSLIYMQNDPNDKLLGAHAIVIVGWGTYHHINLDKTVLKIPYWICLNSWGSEWGTSGLTPLTNRTGIPKNLKGGGYFWIVRGINNCLIEDNIYAGQPDLENISYPGTVEKYGWGLPGPDKSDVKFLDQRIESKIKLSDAEYLSFGPSTDGGGTYAGRTISNSGTASVSTYFLKSMDIPSPYTLFWSDIRPIYCIGTILNEFNTLITNDTLVVDKDTNNIIISIINIQKNPLFVIDEEQFQLLDSVKESSEFLYKVYRGVNNSNISFHSKGSQIKIIPYKELSVPILDKICKKCEYTE